MAYNRLPLKDPRTVAREIPGILQTIFPQLTASTVTHLNQKATQCSAIDAVPNDQIEATSLAKAMLFELAYARAEQVLIQPEKPDWTECLSNAVERQRVYFDSKLPEEVSKQDYIVAELVAENLVTMLREVQRQENGADIVVAPEVAGYQWIASGVGDFSLRTNLIEVKCSSRNFSSADYRQVLMYWLLSYASVIEGIAPEWETVTLLNPRRNVRLQLEFDELIEITSSMKSKIETLELFSFMVGDYALKVLPEFKM